MSTIFYITVLIGSIFMLVLLYRGPLFVPTRRKDVSRVIEMLRITPGEKIIDLGSGDGRLLIAIAKAGAEAHGYEHNPLLVMKSKLNFKKEGVVGKAFVHMRNFWDVDISQFNGVVIYGIPYIMARLEKKLERELRQGARVVSYSFQFPNWEPTVKEKAVYLYKK